MEPKLSRRSVLVGMPSLGILAACGAPVASAIVNPAASGWLGQLGTALGASLIEDALKNGAPALEDWYGPTMEWLSSKGKEGTGYHGTNAYISDTAKPPFLVVRYHPNRTPDDPAPHHKSYAGMILNYGDDAVDLPPWAWQTVVMFCDAFLANRDDPGLRQEAKALMQAALAPTSSDVERHHTWANAVHSMSYSSLLGPVDIAAVENEDHTLLGVIKAAGIPDGSMNAKVSHFPLPTADAAAT